MSETADLQIESERQPVTLWISAADRRALAAEARHVIEADLERTSCVVIAVLVAAMAPERQARIMAAMETTME